MKANIQNAAGSRENPGRLRAWFLMAAKDLRVNKGLYLLAIPGLLFYILFHYAPMYGLTIAFKDYSQAWGIMGSPWVGLEHFKTFFGSIYSWQIIRNTLLINLYVLVFCFPMPIILALLLNELRSQMFKKTVQTITYLPHFISMVVMCGMIVNFVAPSGIITQLVNFVTGKNYVNLLHEAKFFRPIYIISALWKDIGWNSIIYLAAISGLDMELYEAAQIDGAKKLRQLWHITLPGIAPTIIILLIMQVGHMMSVGSDKILLLYNPVIYETADVISTHVYRKGLVENDPSYSAAVGLFNSVINCVLVYGANWFSRKVSETSLW